MGKRWPLESLGTSGTIVPMDTNIFINESLARGLRKALLDNTRAKMRLAEQRIARWANARGLNRTQKGWRRAYSEIDQTFGTVALMRTAPSQRLAAWVTLEGIGSLQRDKLLETHPWLEHLEGSLAFSAMLVDLLTMQVKFRSIPVMIRSHAIERMFQRMATTEWRDLLTEVAGIPSISALAVCSTVQAHREDLIGDTEADPMAIAFPTPTGILLGDMIPATRKHEAFIELNTFVGGRRPLTGPKAALRKRLDEWHQKYARQMSQIAVSMPLLSYAELSRTAEFRVAAAGYQDYLAVMRDFSSVVRQRDDRNDRLVRSDMAWRWARAQADGNTAVLMAAGERS